MKLLIKHLKCRRIRKFFLLCLSVIFSLFTSVAAHAAFNPIKEITRPIYEVRQRKEYQLAHNTKEKSSLQQGQQLYQSGSFSQAIQVWQTAVEDFKFRGDISHQALVLSYLSLTYQQLGQFSQAEVAMEQAIALITANNQTPNCKFIFAQILNNQGQLLLNTGKVETALLSWQKSHKLYQELSDKIGAIGTRINQAQALQSLGMYRRAYKTLESVEKSLKNLPDQQIKVDAYLNLGNLLRVTGEFSASEKILKQALTIAQQLKSTTHIQQALFNLGNLAYSQEQPEKALEFYQKAAKDNTLTNLPAQIHQLELLVELNHRPEAEKLLPQIQALLKKQPPNQTTIYSQIELAQTLLKMGKGERGKGNGERGMGSNVSSLPSTPTPYLQSATLLARAAQQAKILGNTRGESYALGYLGNLYERTQQLESAKNLTQQALDLATAIRAPDIAYQWQWQMGRIQKATGDIPSAIDNYTIAVRNLQSLRQDLVAINQDMQFSFKENVEPVYRELVDLLLSENPHISSEQKQKNLVQARSTIEALQLAEIANYFRQACEHGLSRSLEQVDKTAAIIYPIILPNRLEVIVSLPGKPLKHYATNLPQAQMEEAIDKMRQSLRRTSFTEERLAISQQIFTWLIQPYVTYLTHESIQTLVFVLDGYLSNIPVAALHDGNNYLVEKYRIAIAPSLQLFNPQPIASKRLQALVAGMSEAKEEFSGLPGVRKEVEKIKKMVSGTVLLDKQFTVNALESKVRKLPFSVMHLATHGQFSSKRDETFILTWDGRINFYKLNNLLQNRELSDIEPIELLVLSACQTARGDNRAALGLAGLAVRSGARSTLASLWAVNDESTANFMVHFYEELLQKEVNKAEALRQAQLHLLKNPEYNHPYFWAPFILVGNWL